MKPYSVANGPQSHMYPNREETEKVYGAFRILGEPTPLMSLSRRADVRVSLTRIALKSLMKQGKVERCDSRGNRWIRWE